MAFVQPDDIGGDQGACDAIPIHRSPIRDAMRKCQNQIMRPQQPIELRRRRFAVRRGHRNSSIFGNITRHDRRPSAESDNPFRHPVDQLGLLYAMTLIEQTKRVEIRAFDLPAMLPIQIAQHGGIGEKLIERHGA